VCFGFLFIVETKNIVMLSFDIIEHNIFPIVPGAFALVTKKFFALVQKDLVRTILTLPITPEENPLGKLTPHKILQIFRGRYCFVEDFISEIEFEKLVAKEVFKDEKGILSLVENMSATEVKNYATRMLGVFPTLDVLNKVSTFKILVCALLVSCNGRSFTFKHMPLLKNILRTYHENYEESNMFRTRVSENFHEYMCELTAIYL